MKFNSGDKVAYSVKFLRSIGEGPTSPMYHARGTISEIKNYGPNCQIALIDWENSNNFDGILPHGVNCFNLAKVPGTKTLRDDGSVGVVQPNADYCAVN